MNFQYALKQCSTFNLCVVLILALTIPFSASSETPSPDKFFDDEYVKGTLSKNNKEKDKRFSDTEKLGNNLKNKRKSGDSTNAQEDFISPIFPTIKDLDEDTRKLTIQKASYIINGQDIDAGFEELKVFSDFLIKHQIAAEKVFILGKPLINKQDIPYDWSRILSRGGSISFSRKPITEYGIEKVPAWIFRTENGDVLLEGYKNIDKFINSDGTLKIASLLKEEDVLTKKP